MLVSHRAPLILFAKSFHNLVQTVSTVSEFDLTRQKYNAEKEKKNSHRKCEDSTVANQVTKSWPTMAHIPLIHIAL